jgi:hypothetical protein
MADSCSERDAIRTRLVRATRLRLPHADEPRSGTTFLHRLILQDPCIAQMRFLLVA